MSELAFNTSIVPLTEDTAPRGSRPRGWAIAAVLSLLIWFSPYIIWSAIHALT
ncbi:MAG TPA: hypothetical protein VEA36_01585 [Candidatus Paceibacterota bacterium]|nr:hypothetical protein [Candidatus Paceibacterota bacterium]